MAITPMIVIGCGGSGGKVIASLRRTLEIQLQNADWDEGIPDAWQLIYVDTPAAQEVDFTYGPPVPAADYVSLSQGLTQYRHVDEAVMNAVGAERIERFLGWRPAPAAPVPVNKGAGQWRAIGRVAAFNGLSAVGARISQATNAIQAGKGQLERLGEKLGYGSASVTDVPFCVVVSSLAGGTGAGIFLDVADVVRAVDPRLHNQVAGVLFTAEVFRNLNNAPGVYPNTLAAVSELVSAYSDLDKGYEELFSGLSVNVAMKNQGKTGINYPFIVGMTTIEGAQLQSIPDAYRSVSETLAATMMSSQVAERMLQFQVGNWILEQSQNTTAWSFGNATRPDGLTVETGVVSSFGSARLSVGVARFGEYARARLARQVVEYLADGYIDQGRSLMNDPQATPEQITDYFVADLGMRFVEDCGLRELNDTVDDGHSHDQVLDALMPSELLDEMWKSWWQSVFTELSGVGGSRSTAAWTAQIMDLVPRRVGGFRQQIESRLQSGSDELMKVLPGRVLTQVSQYMAQYGVPVTLALLHYAMRHVNDATAQLRTEAAMKRAEGGRAGDGIAVAWQGVPARQDLPSNHQTVREATRRGSASGLSETRAMHRDFTAQFLARFHDQVLVRLEQQLRQIQGQLAGDDARAAVRHWPVDDGVPEMFAPPPLEKCLVDPDSWPDRYTQLLRQTASDERGPRGTAEEVVRRLVGGGGFAYERDGQPVRVAPALDLEQEWTGGPVQLRVALSVDDIEERARLWLTRRGTVFGDFLRQKLGSYLSPTGPGGVPVPDHQDRLNRFRDGLQQTLDAASPLVEINPITFKRVHPNSGMSGAGGMTTLISEPLPFLSGPAFDIAQRVLEGAVGSRPDGLGEFFTDGSADREGVLYVSRLAGAVHPAVVTSLTRPIQASWTRIRTDRAMVEAFWQNRRARRLDEFVPLAPENLEKMIAGWFVGRLLGRISDPDPQVGFEIAYKDEVGIKLARFPWPLLRSGSLSLASPESKNQWLPAILESLGLAYVMYATEPELVVAYDEMFRLGTGEALSTWVISGDSGPAAPRVQSQLAGTTLDERKASAVKALVAMHESFKSINDNQQLLADSTYFFQIPFGFELFERYLLVFNLLEQRVAGIENVVEFG